MSWSQENGRLTKVTGDIRIIVPLRYSGPIMPMTSPMSWKVGSQLQSVTSGLRPNAFAIRGRLARTLSWATITPLGSLVEPEVY